MFSSHRARCCAPCLAPLRGATAACKALLVFFDAADKPVVMAERLFVLDDMRMGEDGKWQPFLASHPEQMHGRLGNILLVNGKAAPVEAEAALSRVERWRIVNTSNARTMHIDIAGEVLVRVVGTDGGLLTTPFVLDKPLTVAVAQRYDLEVVYGAVGKATLRSIVAVVGANNKVEYKPFSQVLGPRRARHDDRDCGDAQHWEDRTLGGADFDFSGQVLITGEQTMIVTANSVGGVDGVVRLDRYGQSTCAEKCATGGCDDSNPCTVDTCVALTASCVHKAVDNGVACGSGAKCSAGKCVKAP